MIALPTTFHFLFSRLGYNPTDDGFILAYSRRLLRLQVPHRDFISIRPVGSGLLHLPELLFGPYTFWVSRWVVWTEFGIIGASWLVAMTRAAGRRLPTGVELSLVTAAVILSAHTFPMMAWHTVDGAMLCSAGIALCLSSQQRARVAGWLLLGLAPLCKQNFAVVPIAGLLLIPGGDVRERLWLAVPGGLYLLVLLFGRAFTPALQQLLGQSELTQVGWSAYVDNNSFVWGCCLGLALAHAQRWIRPIGAAVVVGVGTVLATHHILASKALFPMPPNFALAGCAFGFAAGLILRREWFQGRIALLGFVLCWATSISLGYNTPAVAAGAAFLIIAVPLLTADCDGFLRKALVQIALCALVLVGVVWFVQARMTKIYREPAAKRLTRDLGGIMPGGRLLRTDPNTAAFIADLNRAVADFGGEHYALIPDFPGWWAVARASNPLPLDWFYPVEMPTTDIRNRAVAALDAGRGRFRLIVQKVRADSLASGFAPLSDEYSPVVQHARSTWRPVGETEFFVVYE